MSSVQRLHEAVVNLAIKEGRKPGTLGHRRAGNYIVECLHSIGLEPYSGDSYRLPFNVSGFEGLNIAALAAGINETLSPLLIGAHYDSFIEAPCADDNAAAVAIVLEIALGLVTRPIDRDVVIAFFDSEEAPYTGSPAMGSLHFLNNQVNNRGIACAIIQDLTGHDVKFPIKGKYRRLPRIRNLLFMTGAESHPDLVTATNQCRRLWRLPLIAIQNHYLGDVSDHLAFRRARIPYLFFSCGRWEHYHRETDTAEVLSYRKMARIARFIKNLLTQLAARSFEVSGVIDTTEFELKLLRKALGPWLLIVRRVLKLGKINGRSGLDKLVAQLLKIGL